MAVKWMTIRDLVTTCKPKELRSTCLFEWLQMQERRLLPHLIFVKLLKELGFGLCLREKVLGKMRREVSSRRDTFGLIATPRKSKAIRR